MNDVNNLNVRNEMLSALSATTEIVSPNQRKDTFMNSESRSLENHAGDNARPLSEIVQAMLELTRGWPKVVDGSLMARCASGEITKLSTTAALFAFIGEFATVDWKQGRKFHTKEEFFHSLIHHGERYQSIENFPHYGPIDGFLYLHPNLPQDGGGKLEELLDYFTPATPEDRTLIRAFICTLLWGGTAGSRPLFVITNSFDDGPDTGRGIGKSTLIELIADLVGGYIDVDSRTDISTLETRLLSSAAKNHRVVRIDNVKSEKLSSAGLERLITAKVISGRRLYQGEGQRPNYLTFAMTMNGVNVSEDLASRSVVIKLSRPAGYLPSWKRDVQEFVKENHWAIIADIIAVLKEPISEPLQGHQRHAEWEGEVLARQPGAQAALSLLLTRRGEIDGDSETVREFLCELRRRSEQACGTELRLTVDAMCAIVKSVTGESVSPNKVKKYVMRLAVPGLTHQHRNTGGAFIWVDPEAAAPPLVGLRQVSGAQG